jgi:formylglycine-generating enzyme required for sulfatase activity
MPMTKMAAMFAAILLLFPTPGCNKKDGAPPAGIKTITTPAGIEMVLISAGDFVMGGDGDEDEKPAHKVHVDSFYMDRTEVTQRSFETLMGTNPSRFKGPDRPVESLAWHAAIKYCNMRSLKERLKPCYNLTTLSCDFEADGYRLATEAEWEYACRAGSTSRFSFGDAAESLGEHAWFNSQAGQSTHPVGRKKANAWGLYDMHGNVAEWCNDCYSATAYASAATDNPRGPSSGDSRVLRGGSWRSTPERCRSAARAGESPGLADACFGYEAYGFRCVRRSCSPS